MNSEFRRQIVHFAKGTAAMALALLAIMLLLILIRPFWRGPVDPIGIIEGILERTEKHEGAGVSVEYRDKQGMPMALGSNVRGYLQTGPGRACEFVNGWFVACNPAEIKAGVWCLVMIAEGKVKQRLLIQLDSRSQALFVESKLTPSELIKQINEDSGE